MDPPSHKSLKSVTNKTNSSPAVNASHTNHTSPIPISLADNLPKELTIAYIFVGLSAVIILIFVLRAMSMLDTLRQRVVKKHLEMKETWSFLHNNACLHLFVFMREFTEKKIKKEW